MFAGIRQPISFIGRYIVKRYDKLGYVKENKKNFYIILVCFCKAKQQDLRNLTGPMTDARIRLREDEKLCEAGGHG